MQLIKDHGIEPEIRLYLDKQLNKEELKEVLEKLGITAEELVRKQEGIFKELYKGKQMTDEDYFQAILEHPRLMERPVVIAGDRAIIGRPPENVRQLF